MSKHRFSADTDSSSAGKPDEEETKTDRLFERSFSAVEDFKFGAETAAVFERSGSRPSCSLVVFDTVK
jgi:hypothetical protein